MNKHLIKGTIVGIIAPIAAFVVYVAFFTNDSDPLGTFQKIVAIDKLSHVISLSVLINLLIFFMNIKTNKDQQAKGILLSTLLYGIYIAILKFI
jgi:hypothetical protein